MNLNTALNHQDRFIHTINDIFMTAETIKLSHRKILERIKAAIWKDSAYQQVPRHVREFVSGYLQCALANHEKIHTQWMHQDLGTKEFYSSWKAIPKDRKMDCIALQVYKNNYRMDY